MAARGLFLDGSHNVGKEAKFFCLLQLTKAKSRWYIFQAEDVTSGESAWQKSGSLGTV